MKELHPAILRIYSFGDSERTIAEALRIPKTTVFRSGPFILLHPVFVLFNYKIININNF